MRRHASRIAGTAMAATISVPLWARASKPQNVTVSARSWLGPTGQPECQLRPGAVAVRVGTRDRNGGAAETPTAVGARVGDFDRVGVGVGVGTAGDGGCGDALRVAAVA